MAFPEVVHRQLSGGHTHLYTERSPDHMAQEFKLRPLASWWFGTDMVDLMRAVYVRMLGDERVAGMAQRWLELVNGMLDEMQLAIDKKHLSSEIHRLLGAR